MQKGTHLKPFLIRAMQSLRSTTSSANAARAPRASCQRVPACVRVAVARHASVRVRASSSASEIEAISKRTALMGAAAVVVGSLVVPSA
jgi:hypothetical protein